MKPKLLHIFIAILLSCAVFAACSKDKEGSKDVEPSQNASIIGSWRQDFGNGYWIMTFEKSGVYTFIEIDHIDGNWSETSTWSLNGNFLTLVDGDGKKAYYTIMTLTSTQLVLRYENGHIGQSPDYSDEDIEVWYRVP